MDNAIKVYKMNDNEYVELIDDVIDKISIKDALHAVLTIREERQKIYGDNWKQMKDWELLAMIKQKIIRFEHLTFSKTENDYEKRKDTLIDLINYTLFALENELNTK